MTENKYMIRNQETGDFLVALNIEYVEQKFVHHEITWAEFPAYALKLNQEEAQATIQFINDVIDWELAQQLSVELLGPCYWQGGMNMNYQEYQKARDAAKLATKIDQAIALFELNTGFVYPTDWRLHVNTLKKSLQDLSRAEREQLLQDLEEEFNRWI